MAESKNAHITFPEKEFKVQSPFLYLQTVGSTGADGSTYGAHLRWLLLRNLGETHLPKGDYAATTINFNRQGDYVALFRSQYLKRFPTTVDFSVAPDVVNDGQAFWIYTTTNTNTVVYIHFRDTAKYATVRASISPSTQPLKFVEQYCPALIEAEVKDKLFFAAEFDVNRDATTVMRTEALSVEANVPLSPVFVSCRTVFTDRNWCPPDQAAVQPKPETTERAGFSGTAEIPACCDGPNLLLNGGFEFHPAMPEFMFETDYEVGVGRKVGAVNVTPDASKVNPVWEGLPHSGKAFLTVDGSVKAGSAVLRSKLDVTPETDYCFHGWLATLWKSDVSIPLQFRFTSGDGAVQSFKQSTPATVGKWEEFTFTWNSGASRSVTVEIISQSTQSMGNDFGIDDLWFCKGKREPVEVPACCDGPNLLRNGGFESPAGAPFGFETDYALQGGSKFGAINVTTDASKVNPLWEGLPHSGKAFLTVDGSVKAGSAVLRSKLDVAPETDYCFHGWLATLWKSDVSIPLQFRFTSGDGAVQSFKQSTPATVGKWEEFTFTWNSGASRSVTVEIISQSTQSMGNDFGIDDLWFCKGKREPVEVPACCDGPNLLRNGGFESHPAFSEFMFETDYEVGVGRKVGAVNVTTDASKVNPLWKGLPHSGKAFLTVDGSLKPAQAALRFKRDVEPNTSYCFTGWLATLWKDDVSVPLQFRFTSGDGAVQSFTQSTPATAGKWEEFTFTWNSRTSRSVTVEIISQSTQSMGNDFGIDDLWFCKGKQEPVEVPACCDGPNRLLNGGFEFHPAMPEFMFETDYEVGVGAKSGAVNVTKDAAKIRPGWQGLPHTGKQFLAVDGSLREGSAVLRFKLEVDPETDYCFAGWLATLWLEEVSIPLQFRFTSQDGTVRSFTHSTPATILKWEQFSFSWNSGGSRTAIVEIVSLAPQHPGQDVSNFGIDDLWFCKGKREPVEVPACCDGPNLLRNGGFENPPGALMFQTDYAEQGGAKFGAINTISDASKINSAWAGLPHSGNSFLAVDGSEKAGSAVLRFTLEVQPETYYCFTGWLATLWQHDVSIPLQFRFTSADGTVQLFTQSTPASVRKWEEFSLSWYSGASRSVKVEIVSLSTKGVGNDFGIDDLWFCKAKRVECRARIMSENTRSVRFDVTGGYPRRIEFETYHDYIAGARWDSLDNLALTTTDNIAFSRLEPSPNSVNGRWQKFNDNARLNVLNYKDRWIGSGGLSQGVQRYIALSNTDPMAIDSLTGDVPQDGSIQISLLDALRMVSLDFHVARMLGMGYLDRDIKKDTDEFIYLAMYDTAGPLDDTNVARPVRHYFMSVPTRPVDYRLPSTPVLRSVTYGLTVDNGEETPSLLTDPEGYTPDGLSRYINLFMEPEPDTDALGPFFVPPVEFCSIDKTSSVFYGVEYRKQGEAAWRKPEIAHDAAYKDCDSPTQFETLPIPNNAGSPTPILRHEERENAVHEYAGYGINWFSRVSSVGNIVATDATLIKKAQRLLPPANFAVQLIQPESPLMLTTKNEQDMLAAMTGPDRTLVRVTFDYFHVHDINYAFAGSVELFFRSELPRNVVGATKSVTDDPSDNHKAVIRTMGYAVNSQGTTISPALAPSLFGNFIGGVLSCQNENYVVTDISSSSEPGEGPIFTVQKNVRGNASDPGSTGTFLSVQEYVTPDLALSNAPVMFMAVENMAEPNSWGLTNPLSKVITLGAASWTAHQETYVRDGETLTANLRGVWALATITHTPTALASGVYRVVFDTYQLAPHPQHGDPDPVDWYKGAVRVALAADPNGPKKVLEVLRAKNSGIGQPLELDVLDNAYDANNQIVTGGQIEVNYYPGYRVYLHADASHNLTQGVITPTAGEGSRKTWLGARSCDSSQQYYSPVGIPAPIVALEFIKALPPEQPHGGEFATWPDYYYKSSYTFTMDFKANHKPFSVVMYRANDEAILRSLYSDDTYNLVRQKLELLGDDDPYQSDRWRNLVSFDYTYSNPNHPFHDPTGASPDGTFRKFPLKGGYAFPNPDKGEGLNGSTPGTIIDELKEAIWGAFTPLTELPLVYDFIRGPSYVPVPKRQNIRNSQGTLLNPDDPAFDMAPMAKRTGNGFEIQFTDFTLDGTNINIFFYCGREIGNRGRMGDPSPIAGPIQLINTRSPDAPAVKKMYVEELNLLDGTGPAVNFEVNAYPDVQKVGRMLIYRATDPADALSVRTMQLVKTVGFAETNQLGNPSIFLSDDFENGFVPYGDSLFYRIVALRKVNNPNGATDWAPSQPSKLLLTAVPDTINPEAPEITFTSNGLSGSPAMLSGVVLSWVPTVHNGTYHLDKMNPVGNWTRIYRVKTNDSVTLDLAATDLGTNILRKETEDEDASVYHRFRVVAENSSGLFNLTDRVLTI